MPNRVLQSRLAAKTGIRQVEASRQADAAAAAADLAVGGVWRALLAILRDDQGPAANYRRALAVLQRLQPELRQVIQDRLQRVAKWGHRSAAQLLVQTLPIEYLRAAAPVPPEAIEGRLEWVSSLNLSLVETHPPRDQAPVGGGAAGAYPASRSLLEAPEPAEPAPSPEELRRIFAELIFPAPSKGAVERIVFAAVNGRTWQDRIAGLSRLAPPELLASLVANGMAEGKTQAQIARDLLPAVNGVRSSAKRVARTESIRVAAAMQQEAHDELGDIAAGLQIHATLDNNTRPLHRARNGSVWMKDSNQSKQEALQLENGAEHPPDAPNCMLPGTLVQGRIQAALKAWYSGKVVEIRTARGYHLTLTVNHPVATKNGFVPAGQINKGDYLVSYLREHQGTVPGSNGQKQHAPVLIENVFEAFQGPLPVAVKLATPFDLHGDGAFVQGKIYVVSANGSLLADVYSQSTQGSHQGEFNRRSRQQIGLPGGRSCQLEFDLSRGNLSSLRAIPHLYTRLFQSRGNPSFADSKSFTQRCDRFSEPVAINESGEIGHPSTSCLLGATNYNSRSPKMTCQGNAFDTSLLGQPSHGLPRTIALDQFGQIANFGTACLGSAAELDASLSQPAGQSRVADLELFGELMNRFASQVTLDQVVDVQVHDYSGFVYDVQTATGYSIASQENGQLGGICISNCRCHLSVVLAAPESIKSDPAKLAVFRNNAKDVIPDPVTYSDWFDRADEKTRKLAVGARKYAEVQKQLGDQPVSWEHFISHKDGLPLTIDQLRAETAVQRAERLGKVRALVAERQRLIRQASTFGFILQ